MSTVLVLAQLLRSEKVARHERPALIWALNQAALEDDAAVACRDRLALAMRRLEESDEAAHSARASQILQRETAADADRIVEEVCRVLLDDASSAPAP